MPRPYRLGQRKATTDQTRTRILEAARALLMAEGGYAGFSIDAVARHADVARMTVYYQFGSRIGLLEALSDHLAERGGMEGLANAFQQAHPLDALAVFIQVFERFWDTDRLVTRRLRALAALDPDFAQVIQARDERRRDGLRVLISRLVEHQDLAPAASIEETIDILHMLTSFESFDMLAGASRGPADVAPILLRLAHAALGTGGARIA